jgi:hypothetical protein
MHEDFEHATNERSTKHTYSLHQQKYCNLLLTALDILCKYMMCKDIIAKIYLRRVVTLKKFTLCYIFVGEEQIKTKNKI